MRVLAASLTPWQTHQLRQAAQVGRRHIKVKELCHKLDMPRSDVLHWLRTHESTAPLDAAVRPKELGHNSWGKPLPVQQSAQQAPLPPQPFASEAAPQKSTRTDSADGEQLQGPEAAGRARPRLTRQAIKTLDAVLALEAWPSKEVLSEISLVHNVPRQEVLNYVKMQRN
ncbi:hypothetical protein WJX73_009210 [Symbiochloris irregularis]|uniref:Uncharacterized protein n=1 Tax=Symbiochloris irregularis TaxID=706552 RepID=A0AAW1NLS8_9CHLO